MKRQIVREIAELYGVEKHVAQNWVRNGLFPNAKIEDIPIFGKLWKVPESDLQLFSKPAPGRPKKEKKAA